jgi:hypothetical protein
MTSWLRFSSLAGGALLLASAIAGLSHAARPSVTQEAIQLLDKLAGDNLTDNELSGILRQMLATKDKNQSVAAAVLDEAGTQGALSREAIRSALSAEGCRGEAGTADLCTRLLTMLRHGGSPRNDVISPATAKTNHSIERVRQKLLESEASGGAPDFLRAEYAEALMAKTGGSLEDLLRLFVRGSSADLPPEDRASVRAMATGAPAEDAERLGFERLRQVLGSILRERLNQSRGRIPIVREIRRIPSELLVDAWKIDAAYGGRLLNGEEASTKCTIDAWRQTPDEPNQWLAWKELLRCRE